MLNILNNTRCKTKTRLTENRKKMLETTCKLNRLLSVCLLSLSGSTYAASGSVEETAAYVDSVYGWGAWELGLEPAAGGTTPSPSRALSSRGANIVFRPNDNSAFAPNSRRNSAPTPPTFGPIAPGQPLPTGNPADRWL